MNITDDAPRSWSETDSQHFIEVGKILIPSRDEIQETILDLIPADPDEPFLAVELGVGGGWLSEAILTRFPATRILGFDGSPAMLAETDARLQQFAGRYQLKPFRLKDSTWLDELTEPVHCFVSSLVLHHLDAAGKQRLYRELYQRLDVGGAVLIADLVTAGSERERRSMAKWWDAEVRQQSLSLTGSLDVYHRFVKDEWNWFEYPDPIDIPSTVPEHLAWLTAAGFVATDVFWARAGHAVYGGYKAV